MRKFNLVGVSVLSAGAILVMVFIVLSLEGGLTGVASYDPIVVGPKGYQGYPGYTPPSGFAIMPSGVARTLPGRGASDLELLNFGSFDNLLELLVQQFSVARSAGYITETQYSAVAEDAVFILRLGVQQSCISEQDSKTAVRLLIGTGRSESFKEQYSKAFDCLKEKGILRPANVQAQPTVETPVQTERPVPSYPITVYEGDWTVNADGLLRVRGYSGEFALSADENPVNVSIEVVQDGFNAVDDLLLQIRGRIDDPDFDIRSGTLSRDGFEIPVTIRHPK